MGTPIRSYRDLEVWQRGVDLAASVYELCNDLPRAERFRFGDQLIRAAVSVPANIAEGYGRRRRMEYVRFLDIANGSLSEVETHLEVYVRLGVASRSRVDSLIQLAARIGQMLVRLRRRLKPGPP